MIEICVYDPEGRVISNMTLLDAFEANMNMAAGQRWIFGNYDTDTHYVSQDTAIPRPTTQPYPDTLAAPATLDMQGFPAGTTVTVTDQAGDSVSTSDPADPVVLPDPGTYEVGVAPPFPYVPSNQTIEVV